MKILKVVAVCLIIAQIIYKYISGYGYYEFLINNVSSPSPYSLLNLSEYLLWFLLDLLIIICGILSLASPGHHAYKLFRFINLISAIFYLPELGFYLLLGERVTWEFLLIQITWLFCTIVLILAKPEKPVQKINLSDYEIVRYTSTGHRLLHYLLDILFLLPMVLLWRDNIPGLRHSPLGLELFFVLVYILYCFFSEAIFRQTFGKLITRSCIVSNGVQLSTGRVLVRTLSRLIPFDKLSFLFGGNWHDRLSATTVVYVDSWQKAFEEEKG